MCNDFGNHVPYSDYIAAFSQTRIPVRWPKAAPNLEPREDIWPTDKAPVIRRLEDGTNEFAELRWGFPPARPKGPPVINFRSEGRRFPVGRCLVPASHFFEFTGACPASAPMRQIERVEEGSDCLLRQAGSGCHGRRSRRIALRIVMSLRATATRARS